MALSLKRVSRSTYQVFYRTAKTHQWFEWLEMTSLLKHHRILKRERPLEVYPQQKTLCVCRRHQNTVPTPSQWSTFKASPDLALYPLSPYQLPLCSHSAQLCWPSYCCLNKPSSSLDQGPYCCYPPPSSSTLSTRLEPSLHSSLCSNCMSLRRSLIIPFKGTDWSSFFHFSSSIIFLHCIYLCLEITYFLFTCWWLVFCLRL